MNSDFFFSLIRISCAQIFRAAGIERCSPHLLDAATDLLVRHLSALSVKASDYAALSGRNEVVIQDVALAMEAMGVIRPRAILDPYDLDPNSFIGFENFIEWVKGPVPEEARRISRVPRESQVAQLAKEVPGISNPGQSEKKTGDERAKDTIDATNYLKDRSDTNIAKTNDDLKDSKPTSQDPSLIPKSTSSPPPTKTPRQDDEEWLTALMKKKIKVGNDAKFKGTLLALDDSIDAAVSETKIAGGPINLEDFQPENLSV